MKPASRLALVLALVVLPSASVLANSQASPSTYVKPPLSGRSDGVYLQKSISAPVMITNGSVDHTESRPLYCEVFEDFLGATVIPANGALDAAEGPWAVKDTSAAGSPALAIKGDADDGQFEMTLAATNEAENLDLYWNDEQSIDTDQGPVVIFRLQTAVALTAGKLVFGLASARNDTIDNIANNAWFLLAGDGNLLVESDDGTTDDDDNDTLADLTAGTWYEFKVDCSVPTDCDFFYRATIGGDWTELLSTTPFSIGANAQVQPYVQLQKASGTSVPSVLIDYVQVYWQRSTASGT